MSAEFAASHNQTTSKEPETLESTGSDFILTPRQHRALRYLARRRMRHARITRRKASLKSTTGTPLATGFVPNPSQDILDTSLTLASTNTTSPARNIDLSKSPDTPALIDNPRTSSTTITSHPPQGAASTPPENVQVGTSSIMNFNKQDRECHPERSEGSDALGTEILRGVYPERSEWAQDDNLLPDLVVKVHNRHSTAPTTQTPSATPRPARDVLAGLASARTTITRNLPPMPPLPLRPPYKPAPVYKQQSQIITVRRKQRPHTLTRRQKLLGHLSRKHLRRARAGDHRAYVQFWTAIWTTILLFTITFVSLGTTGSVTAYSFFHRTQLKYEHQVDTLRSLLPLDNLKIYDSKGVLLAQLADQGIHTTVNLDQVSPFLINATIAAEDKTFWTNEGIDLEGIIRAALDDLRSGRIVEGGSTITQQLIKNLIVGNQATIIRKLEELVLTPLVNSRYTKRDILEMYLNCIYYGHQAYGIDAAATIYFGLEDYPGQSAASQLDLAQSAMLAAIPSNPSLYDPLLNPKVANDHFVAILGLMEMQKYITKVQALDAMSEAQDPHFFKTGAILQNRAPHFVNFVLSQLEQIFHLRRSQLSRSGISVYTTLDIALQDKIQKIAQRQVAELRDTHHVTNAAEVLIDFHTGAIISLLGSIDFYNTSIDGQVDVTQSYRQPGSSFKPYVYVTAFEQGISPAQAIVDDPTTIELPGGNPQAFTPHNYDLSYHGHMTLRCALQNSLNVPAVKVLQHVGINAAMQTAAKMGITSYRGTPGYSLVLGGLGIRLLDHTSAMGVFANEGVREDYYAVNKVVSVAKGKVIYQHSFNPGKRVLSPQLAYMMTSVLSDNASRIPEFSDCNVLQLYSNSQAGCWYGNRGVVRPAAAKTGTTTDFRDNWTVGYTTDYVMGVWVGNDDNSPMIDVTGVQGAAPIWHDAMLVAEYGHPIRNFANPGGLVQATVTYPDGVKTTDWFLPGKVPTFHLPESTSIATGTAALRGVPRSVSNPLYAQPSHVASYCPSSYSFAFTPPPVNAQSPTSVWW